MAWEWLTAIFGDKAIKLSFDNSKRAGRDLQTSVSREKHLDKSDQSTKTKRKSKDTYNGDVVHSDGAVTVFNGTVNFDVHVTLDKDGNIPTSALPMLAPLTEQFEQKQVAFVAEDQKKTVSDIRSFEDTPEVRGLLRFFKHRLQPADLTRMRTGLYLKHLTDTDRFGQANAYWRQVTVGMRQRDRRIVELASAGYFTSFFRPLYKQLMKANDATAQKRFTKEFEAILEDMRFAIFVSSGMTIEDIVDTVVKKAVKNIKYGSTTEVMSLHAAGAQQVGRVREATVMLRGLFPVMNVLPTPKNVAITRVDIEYRKNNLDDELLRDDIALTDPSAPESDGAKAQEPAQPVV